MADSAREETRERSSRETEMAAVSFNAQEGAQAVGDDTSGQIVEASSSSGLVVVDNDALSLASSEDEQSDEEEVDVEDDPADDELNGETEGTGAVLDSLENLHTVAKVHPEEAVTKPDWRQELVPLILLSLPIDSLHCIASFLSAGDWAAFGQTNISANKVCRDIFRRVRMHGFRCATEVVTAWKLGQHADARELAALYIQSGVPIYPYSLGHSYHTLVWRMGVEATDMKVKRAAAEKRDRANGGDPTDPAENNSIDEDEPTAVKPIDAFYASRHDAGNHNADSSSLSYLEEKCLFFQEHGDDGGQRLTLTSRANFAPPAPVLPNGIQQQQGGRMRFPDFRPAAGNEGMSPPRGLSPSTSLPDLQRVAKTEVKVHRHLVDQYLLNCHAVDDENGAMRASPVSLAADFFHPVPLTHNFDPTRESDLTSTHLLDTNLLNTSLFDAASPTASAHAGFAYDDNDAATNEPQQQSTDIDSTPTQPIMPTLVSPPSPPRLVAGEEGDKGELTPVQQEPSFLANVQLDIYSAALTNLAPLSNVKDGINELKSHLRNRFAVYQRRLDTIMSQYDNIDFEECLLDFWDEFLPVTANIHFYDRHTPVPRLTGLHKFLTKPCPKAFGIVQCEIERVKISPKKKGVKGRLFPTYEYRLFIRDRRFDDPAPESPANDSSNPPRRDTVLMVAKNRGRKHVDESGVVPAGGLSKKGVNNYFMYAPQFGDVDLHYNSVSEVAESFIHPNGASIASRRQRTDELVAPSLLGRLQSNFIGTEFQIFTPTLQKRAKKMPVGQSSVPEMSYESESDLGYDSGVSSDNLSTASSTTSSRRNRFNRSRSSQRSRRRRQDRMGGDHPQPIEEEDGSSVSTNPEKRRHRKSRRSYSLPALSYGRSSRTNRRAIANDIVESTETRQEYQTVLCEEEDGAITYTANLLGNRPRIMDVCIPKVTDDGVSGADWKRYLESVDDATDPSAAASRMLARFKQMQSHTESADPNNPNNADEDNGGDDSDDDYTPPDDFGLLALQNRPPWWNIELGAFVLNFGGRVSVASVKNFQLCDRNDQEHIMLQFGRIQGRHSFTMDYQFPLSPVQAFAIAISSLQSRISFG